MTSHLIDEYDRLRLELGKVSSRLVQTRTDVAEAESRLKALQAKASAETVEREHLRAAVLRARFALEHALAEVPVPDVAVSEATREAEPEPAENSTDATQSPAEPTAPEAPEATGYRRSVLDTIKAFPRDGSEIRTQDLRKKLDLSEGAVNTRLKHCKNNDLVESTGYGRCRLTEKGLTVLGLSSRHLQVVPDADVAEGGDAAT